MSAWETLVTRRSVLASAIAGHVAAVAAGIRPAHAASGVTLVMVEEPGCPYCAKWDREIAPAYANSPEGRFAPLVRVRRGNPDIAHIKGLNYSPTFLVMRGQEKIGRITGYPGADFFWALLDELLVKAGFEVAPTASGR